jgi:hypothetical protein
MLKVNGSTYAFSLRSRNYFGEVGKASADEGRVNGSTYAFSLRSRNYFGEVGKASADKGRVRCERGTIAESTKREARSLMSKVYSLNLTVTRLND